MAKGITYRGQIGTRREGDSDHKKIRSPIF